MNHNTPQIAICSRGHEWRAELVTQPDGVSRMVVPLNCPQCQQAATKTVPPNYGRNIAYA